MHPLTLKPESADAFADSRFGVCGCIHQLLLKSWWVHPATLLLVSVIDLNNLRTERAVAGHTPFQKVKISTNSSFWTHSQLLCQIL